MGIWQHTHTVTTTDVSPDLGELAEMFRWCKVWKWSQYRWGCRTFQTASHIHGIHILGVWTPYTVVDGHMAAHSYRYHHRHIPTPDLGKFAEIIDDVNVKTIPIRYQWGCRRPFKLHPISMSYIYYVFEHLTQLWMEYGSTFKQLPPQMYPQIWESLLKFLDDVNMKTILIRYQWGCRTFQTASHIHVKHILCIWTPYTVVDGHMAAHSYHYHWNHRWCTKCGNDPNTLSLRL